jgi:hypothetical protein
MGPRVQEEKFFKFPALQTKQSLNFFSIETSKSLFFTPNFASQTRRPSEN